MLYSKDYTGFGDPQLATWTTLAAATSKINTGSSSMVNTGELDIEELIEDGYIAVKYTSVGEKSGDGLAVQLDKFVVKTPTPITEGGEVTISEIQGEGDASPLVSQKVTTGGIVTAVFKDTKPFPEADYNGNLKGFYIQNSKGDGNENTSDGVYVYSEEAVNVGDSVSFKAVVKEFNGLTELVDLEEFMVKATDQALPAVTSITLPLASENELEKYEGMLVTFTNEFTVTENRLVKTYGSLRLSADGLLMNPTQMVDVKDEVKTENTSTGKDNVAAMDAFLADNKAKSIVLDDARSSKNASPIAYLDENNTILAGTKVTGVEGVLDFSFGDYKIQPTKQPQFDYATRQAAPEFGVEATLKVAAFNVLNYFNGDGEGAGFPTSRGAKTAEQFDLQAQKIVAAIEAMNADVVGLIEIENDADDSKSAMKDLVDRLNTKMGADTYAMVATGQIESASGDADQIKVGISKSITIRSF